MNEGLSRSRENFDHFFQFSGISVHFNPGISGNWEADVPFSHLKILLVTKNQFDYVTAWS